MEERKYRIGMSCEVGNEMDIGSQWWIKMQEVHGDKRRSPAALPLLHTNAWRILALALFTLQPKKVIDLQNLGYQRLNTIQSKGKS